MISQHWSHYWQAGQLTSLPHDFQNNYTGVIQQKWSQAFRNLNDNSHILDVCTGNCAISLLAATYAKNHKKHFNITAIDAAEINKQSIQERYPDQKENLNNIKLISNCKVEDITLKGKQFDLITSQYGIEYCDWSLAAQQIHRLLKDKGSFIMIAHSGTTEIIKTMQKEKEDYEFLDKINLFKIFTDYYKNIINYTDFIKQLNTKQKTIIQRFNTNPSELIKSILLATDGMVSMQRSLLEAHKIELVKIQKQYVSAYLRLNDLLHITQAINENPQWYHAFTQHGLQLKEMKKVLQNGLYESGTLFKFEKT